jgi:antitoxin MazE
MKTQIIQIGNSQGLRIPKVLLEDSGLEGEVELEVCEEGLLVRRSKKVRKDWDEMFRTMAENEHDEMLDREVPTDFDEKEWRW